jgi:hypothetical protein
MPLPPWSNQDLLLYHGTLDIHVQSIFDGVNPAVGHPSTDFGRGFYTTTNESQARRWAWRLSNRKHSTHPLARPAVIEFKVCRDILSRLETLWFVRSEPTAADFWSLVSYCRSSHAPHSRLGPPPTYDVVVGPVAASWRRQLTLLKSDQVSFHSAKAASILDKTRYRAKKFVQGRWVQM